LRRAGEARVCRGALLGLVALTGLAAVAAGCKSTASCNSGTVLVSIDFDTTTRTANMLDVQVSIDGGAAKTSSIAHKPGDAEGSVEVDFPNGYPDGKRLDVTIVARSGQTVLGSQTATISAVPSGCGTLAITFAGSGNDGGAGAGGGTGRGGMGGATGGAGGSTGGAGGSVGGAGGSAGGGGATGGAGGSQGGAGGSLGGSGGAAGGTGGAAGAAGRGGSGGTAGTTGGTGGATACTTGTTRSCATDGKLGSCAAGTETCTNGVWGACSIAPTAADSCVQGNDDNCNGTKNEGCTCINAVTTKACGMCNDGTQTCTDGKTGTYGACTGGTGQDFTPLTLQNGWTAYGNGTAAPAAGLDCSGTVQLRGALAAPAGSSNPVFTLPAGLRPSTPIWLPVDMLGATKGRLYIDTAGSASVAAETTATNAMGFTSLEGVSFAVNATGYTALSLQNGWAPYSGTRAPAVSSSNGIVRFQGAVASGTSGQTVFTLPAAMAPPVAVYVSVDMLSGKKGRLYIQPSGAAIAAAATTGSASDATGFTSLESAWFALNATGYTALALQTGWTNYSRTPAVAVSGNIVRFEGEMSGGTSAAPFMLPAGFRPASEVWVSVGLCNAAHGRLHILPTGAVTLQAEVAFSDATCFTTLEGVFFGL
jgi:hypothetical protein